MGTSRLSPFGAEGSEDHPHACGDKPSDSLAILKLEGSSPRVWGQAGGKQMVDNVDGIIPTRVGTSYY